MRTGDDDMIRYEYTNKYIKDIQIDLEEMVGAVLFEPEDLDGEPPLSEEQAMVLAREVLAFLLPRLVPVNGTTPIRHVLPEDTGGCINEGGDFMQPPTAQSTVEQGT
jgi:hypothetical protein